MKPCPIVIDTNVLVSGLRSRRGASFKLLSMLNNKRWRLKISTTLVIEYETVLKRKSSELKLSFQDIEDFLDGICSIADQHDIFYLWRPMANDPDDDFLIDLAVSAQADFIITYNKRDLYKIKYFGIVLLSPKEFLEKMGEIRL